MTDIYTKHYEIIQKTIDKKNFKLAIVYLEDLIKKEMVSDNKYGLEECNKLKKKIDDEIIFENALKTFKNAKIEYKKKNYITAFNLYQKARDFIIKSEIMKNSVKMENLSKINHAIYEIKKRINFQNVRDWLLKEKDDKRFNEIVDVLGKIVKLKLELIAPATDVFLKMVDSTEKDTRFRGIKGLGEVAVQRPSWAYTGINKLVLISREDEINDARILALMELSRIGRVNPTMLLEHMVPIIDSLRDRDKNIRNSAVIAIGVIAEGIPLEAKEAIPALKEALNDEYLLVRQNAYKALELFRATMK